MWRTNRSKLGPAKTISAKSVAPLTCQIYQGRKVTEISDEFLYDAFDACLITITAKRITEERATKVPYSYVHRLRKNPFPIFVFQSVVMISNTYTEFVDLKFCALKMTK